MIKVIRFAKMRHSGPVRDIFARWEFQSGHGTGNLPHMHMGVICHPEPIDVTLQRIVNRDIEFNQPDRGNIGDAHFIAGTNKEDAIKHGFVKDEREWNEWFGNYKIFYVSQCQDSLCSHFAKSITLYFI
jgi:hypothetical protein